MKIYHTLSIVALLSFSGCKSKTPTISNIDFDPINKDLLAGSPSGTTRFEESEGLGASHDYTAVFMCPTESD